MEKRIRRILFFVFFSIFISIAPILTLYVQGYRLDFENKRLTQTGGLFIKTITPKQAEVYLDNKLAAKTDFFFSSTLIENLLPKIYNIRVQKQDYYAWEKNLEVKEKQVVEARSIVLFPKDPGFELISSGIKNIWFSKDKKRAVIKEENENTWNLELYNLEKNVKSHLLKETDFYKAGAELISLDFTDDNNLFIEVAIKEQINYFEVDIKKIPPLLTKVEELQPLVENAVTYQILNGSVYYIDNSGYLYKADESLSSKEKITNEPLNIKQETEYKLHIFNRIIFLQEEKTFYLLNQDKKIFEKFSENTNFLKISPDKRKIAYVSGSEIKVFFLEEQTFQPRRQSKETIFLVRLSENIKDISWINPDYLILITNNALKITEIDNRDRVNIIDIATVENPQVFLDLKAKKFYLLDRGNLFVSKNIIL